MSGVKWSELEISLDFQLCALSFKKKESNKERRDILHSLEGHF